jgi:hypothetical protein
MEKASDWFTIQQAQTLLEKGIKDAEFKEKLEEYVNGVEKNDKDI